MEEQCQATRSFEDDVEILAVEAVQNLWRKVSSKHFHEVKLETRIGVPWRWLHKHKHKLTSMQYVLQDRLRLFVSAVTSTVLYGCEARIL